MYNQLNQALDPDLPAEWTPFKEGVLQLHVHWTNESVRQYKAAIAADGNYTEARAAMLTYLRERADFLEREFPWLQPELDRRYPVNHGL